MNITLPDYLTKLDRLPEDPENIDLYGAQGSQTYIIVRTWSEAASDDGFDKDAIIDGIHDCLNDNQGLIEVEVCQTTNGFDSYFSIVKTLKEPSGVIYTVFIRITIDGTDQIIQGYFEEYGETGTRDHTIFVYGLKEKWFDTSLNGWMKDPYDENFTKGILMNVSEEERFDEAFPEHPLSIAREFIQFVIENN